MPKDGYHPVIYRRWSTVTLTMHQLTQMLRDLSLIPEDARFHSFSYSGNPLHGQQLHLTYESSSLPFTSWDQHPTEALSMFEEPDLASDPNDVLSNWE